MVRFRTSWLVAIGTAGVLVAIAATAAFGIAPRRILAQEPTPTPSDNGSVETTVQPLEAPGPCLLLSTESIDYGVVPFSSASTSRFASGEVTVTNCAEEPESILAQGADATGASSTWTIASPPTSGNMCGGVNGGINRFGHTLDDGIAPLALDTSNQTYQTDTAGGAAVVTATTFRMPCSGSNGAGELMSTSITFTAVSPPP